MIIKQTVNNEIDVVAISGPLVLANAEQARQQFKDIVDKGTGRMVLDLAGVDPIDSSGLSVLVATYKWLSARNGELVLAALSPKTQTIFKLMRLNELFRIFKTQDAAIQSLATEA